MVRNPDVSVIIPAYNAGAFLAETLDSVLGQSFRAFEIIVVDDGSTDDTATVVARYGKSVQYVHQANSGAPARPRNVAISLARGQYISIFDSDDVMMPDKLAQSVSFIRANPGLGMVFTDFVHFNEHGDLPGTNMDRHPNFWRLPKETVGDQRYKIAAADAFEALFFGNYIGTSSVIVPASVLRDVGGFDEAVSPGGLEDRDMWFRIARKYPVGFLNAVTHRYRVRSDSVSRRALPAAEARLTVIRRYSVSQLSARAATQARQLVAESLFTIGYQLCLRGDMQQARRYLRESAQLQSTWCAWRWWVLSLLGSRGIGMWRGMASVVGKRLHLRESV